MLHRIREAWASRDAQPFTGPVEVEKTFVGGEARYFVGRASNEAAAELRPLTDRFAVALLTRRRCRGQCSSLATLVA